MLKQFENYVGITARCMLPSHCNKDCDIQQAVVEMVEVKASWKVKMSSLILCGIDVQDVVSVMVHCPEDSSYLLVQDGASAELWILSTVLQSNSNWRAGARKLLKEVLTLETTSESTVKLYRLWMPDNGAFLLHIVFTASVSSEDKRKVKVSNAFKNRYKLRWVTNRDLPRMESLRSPEIVHIIASISGTVVDVPRSKGYRRGSLPQPTPSWTDIIEHDMREVLVEVGDKHLFVGDKAAAAKSPFDQLISGAGFTIADQTEFYKDFLYRSFPSMYMSKDCFSEFCTKINWPKDGIPSAFRAADIFDRGSLSFRELLYFLAAIEPSTPHGGVTAELRCRYIFRYYDKDYDGKLDSKEIRELIAQVKKTKDEPTDPAAVNKEAESQMKSIGLQPDAPLAMIDFLRAVGELKFRGTSLVLRAPSSIKSLFRDAKEDGGKGEPSRAKSAVRKPSSAAPAPTAPAAASAAPIQRKNTIQQPAAAAAAAAAVAAATVTTTGPVSKPDNAADFSLAAHCVKLKKSGTIIGTDQLYDMASAVSKSTTDIEKTMRAMRLLSDVTFDPKSPANELLTGLKYFTQAIAASTKLGAKKPKEAFTWGQVDKNGFAKCLITVCNNAKALLRAEPRLLEIPTPAYILGDFHGNFPDLMNFERTLWSFGPSLSPGTLLFLGDYVDRGPHGIEVISYLLAHKVQCPRKVKLLRGNHETRYVQKMYTFYTECITKFGDERGLEVWEAVNDVFDVMPLAATVADKIFCCHGGIPPPWLCPVIAAINSIPAPLPNPEKESALAWELLWNDPVRPKLTDNMGMELLANEGFAVNSRRGTAHVFSGDALERFLRINNLAYVIRAHEVAQVGFQVQLKGRLLTVFSSSRYDGGSNEAACVLADQNKLRFFRLEQQ